MSDERTPVNKVRVSDSGRQFIVDDCVICGGTHYHGSKDSMVAEGGRSERVSHCGDIRGSYLLELVDEDQPPEHWWTYVGVEK